MLEFKSRGCGVCGKEMPNIEKEIWQKKKTKPDFVLKGRDREEQKETVIKFGKEVGVTYPLGLDPQADIFASYAIRKSGITRNVLIDREGRIVILTRLFKEEEFEALKHGIEAQLSGEF